MEPAVKVIYYCNIEPEPIKKEENEEVYVSQHTFHTEYNFDYEGNLNFALQNRQTRRLDLNQNGPVEGNAIRIINIELNIFPFDG